LRSSLVQPFLEDAVVYQLLETIREEVSGDPEIATEVIEAMYSPKRVAQDEQRPPLTDNREGPLDRASGPVPGHSGKGSR
jgi:hypothetical protein